MTSPVFYRLWTARGSLTLRSPVFVELHQLMLDTPVDVFDFQIGSLMNVIKVEWTINSGADWVAMGKGVVLAEFARVLVEWSRRNNLGLSA